MVKKTMEKEAIAIWFRSLDTGEGSINMEITADDSVGYFLAAEDAEKLVLILAEENK